MATTNINWTAPPQGSLPLPLHPGINAFTFEDEARERLELSPAEVAEVETDVHGLTRHFEACHISDEELQLRLALREFDSELSRIPDETKAVYLEAIDKHPELVNDAHKALFLRASGLDTKVAAHRMAVYWQKRHDLFGPEKCFLPLTLRGALKDDLEAISRGYVSILPRKDAHGRAMLFVDRSNHDPSKYSTKSFIRACWYLYHVLFEDPEVQKKGVIALVSPGKNAHRVDLRIIREGFESIPFFLFRHRAIHYFHPDATLWLVLPFMKFMMGKYFRLRFIVHSGTPVEVFASLSQYGITPDQVPVDIGGTTRVDARQWVCDRLNIEAAKGLDQGDLKQEPSRPRSVAILSPSANLATKSSRKSAKPRGDPRMSRAVAARTENPKMSPLDALIAGGFRFPELGQPNMTDNTTYDEEGVSMQQRKNQLSRRLRLSRQKVSSDSTSALDTEKDGVQPACVTSGVDGVDGTEDANSEEYC